MPKDSPASVKRILEEMAERLALEQIDLLAQVEAQVRSVRHTMRRIEKLRAARHRVGPELSGSERGTVLRALSGEVKELDEQLNTQASCCQAMATTVEKMQARSREMQLRVVPPASQGG
ncbi:MAG: hypothetical protein M3545_16845 [Acidobacteriota bacterium]|nr:hypothetical protein [Acidobacteriota bacterium]